MFLLPKDNGKFPPPHHSVGVSLDFLGSEVHLLRPHPLPELGPFGEK